MSTQPFSVERLPHYTQTERDEITGGVDDPAGVGGTGLVWRGKDLHFGVRQDGRLVAHAGLIEAVVSVGGRSLPVVGLGGVVVAPGLRGSGLARLVVTAAMDHARGTDAELGLLFCWPRLIPLYERLGWRALDGEIEAEQPDGPVTMPLRHMWTPLTEDAHWPAGPARLLSLPM
ncbi:GNAT family N-acetyltransferase [Streptomyces sp. NPDC001858]